MTILDFIKIYNINSVIFIKKQNKINLFTYFNILNSPNFFINTRFSNLVKNNLSNLFYFNISKKSKKIIYFDFNSSRIYFYSLGLLFSQDNLLKKNIRRSFSSLKILITFFLNNHKHKSNINNLYIMYNSFISSYLLSLYLNIFYTQKYNIYGLFISYFKTLNYKIKRNIKRRITKRLIKSL